MKKRLRVQLQVGFATAVKKFQVIQRLTQILSTDIFEQLISDVNAELIQVTRETLLKEDSCIDA